MNSQSSINFEVQRLLDMSLTLYYHILSQPARTVLSLLNLGNIKFEGKVLNLFNGQARTPEYLKINPFGGVPFIIHNNLHLAQSNAILTHLTESYPKQLGKYYGSNAGQRAHINQYLSWYQGSYRPALVRPLRLKVAAWKTSQPYSKKSQLQLQGAMKKTLDFLQNRLNDNSAYIVGNSLSIADLLLYHQTTNVELINFPLSQWPKIQKWYSTVQSNQIVSNIHSQFKKQSSPVAHLFPHLPSTQ